MTTRGTSAEIVGLLPTREAFEAAVADLLRIGFSRSDLSVLTSHDSLEAAEPPARGWKDVLIALVGELKYEGPLVASGAIVLAGGPVAATIAAVIGAAVGGIAVKEALEEVTAKPHSQEFARAVDAGAIVLWVSAETIEQQDASTRTLAAHGATNIHAVVRRATAEG